MMTSAKRGGVFYLGGDLAVQRMGFGAMQLTGPGVWGPPIDPNKASAVLRRAVELDVNFIDTADVYGPGDNECLIRQTLHPYAAGLVIATKGGLVRSGPATRENPGMSMNGTGGHIRTAVEGSLRDLGVERIDLYQLHRVDPATPIEETMSIFRALQDEGKIRHIGLSEVSVELIERARAVVEIASVQNIYNLAIRDHLGVLEYCEAHGIAFIPFWPLHIEQVAGSEVLARISSETGVSYRQVALAWLLQRSLATVLVPGTASVEHLEENVAACEVVLTDTQMCDLEALGSVREA